MTAGACGPQGGRLVHRIGEAFMRFARRIEEQTAAPALSVRLGAMAGGVLWCTGWSALAGCAVLPALGGAPEALAWALVTAAAGMSLLVLAPTAEAASARGSVLVAPTIAATAWLPALLAAPTWLVVSAAATGTICCAVLGARTVRAVLSSSQRRVVARARPMTAAQATAAPVGEH